ncbi:MAG: dehydrogenase [Gammaproteobacteria bacterium]|nr:MAG: dehydrogenase [Gammaproteobacteria bacterium]
MKQVLQKFSDGTTEVCDIPLPRCSSGHILIQSSCSLISVGTERSLVSFGRSNYLSKARQQPDKVRDVINKIKTDGLMPTIEAVKSKLDQPIPMGYSNVGTVIEVGADVTTFKIGDRVLSNGAHAEFVCVPVNLCAKIPDSLSDEDAVFTVLGAIALQGIRLSAPTFGESVAVVGLGLVGLMCAQLAKANGCRVIGFDFDGEKVKLAKQLGIEAVAFTDPEDAIKLSVQFSRGKGVDIALVAAASSNSDPMIMAAKMCRKKGRLTQVGVTELAIPRDIMFKKELTLQVSCSYGPGRYDESYENKGIDYPFDYVRWTEQRNFGAVLDTLAAKNILVSPLISHRYKIKDAVDAYDLLMNDRSALGILLEYPTNDLVDKQNLERTLKLNVNAIPFKAGQVVIGAIGAGNHAGRTLLPAFKKAGARLKIVASSQGLSGTYVAKNLGFEVNTTESDIIMADDEVNTVVIATQHSTHARFVIQALKAGKNVFVEKPLALNQHQLDEIKSAYQDACRNDFEPKLMIGFNRRFSPLTQKMKSLINRSNTPFSLVYTCNAGEIPSDHWLQDPDIGGGRIIGEACHFIDMARFMANSPIQSIQAVVMKQAEGITDCQDTATITLTFENGCIASINYFSNGHKSFAKERIEIFQGQKIIVLDNFRLLKGYGIQGFNKLKLYSQNKGQSECCQSFVDSIESGTANPISFAEQIEVSQACIDVMTQLSR